ncbi:MAG: hydantoinase B/oxoprolinase family protein [Alphaproteobacteria bacterium]|nr:hydantoinase B/oxoprolinase family protein [Alphaproteobacteria bacterium]
MILNPVDQAVISQGLIAAAREMGVKLVRSAYSPILREASDGSAAILDPAGNVVAQAELIPMQLGPISATFAPCARLFPPDQLVEGDFYINNDPYNGGQHLPDVFIFTPIFFSGRLVGFTASVAHHLDLGGGAAGMNVDATDLYQEGLIFPPSKYNLKHDWHGGPFERLVRANIRVPQQTIGDFNAQFAANAVGALRVKELCAKFGPETVAAAMEELLAYSERRMRAAIAAAPDGVYVGEDALDDDGVSETPLRVRAAVTIRGDQVEVDFAGTCDQVRTTLNCPFASTVAAALSCVKAVLTSPDIPFNEGSKRPITIKAPYGSMLNPKPPAPVRARMLSAYRAFDAVMRALAQAVPEKAIAGGFDTTESICLSHLGPSGYRIYLEIFGGGYGAGIANDGCDAVDNALSNCSNIPVEAMELEYDFFRVREYGLRPDSGGAGRHRGGLGLIRRFEILKEGVHLQTYSDRFLIAPQGIAGGEPGGFARTRIERGNERIDLRSKLSLALRQGDLLVAETGGGAGHGAADGRDPTLVAADLADGLLSPTEAARRYGFKTAAE